MKAELLTDTFVSDLTVVNSARVSFGKERQEFDNSDEKGSDKRMTNYLINAKPVPHFAPLCHARETFEFDTNYIGMHELTETDLAGMVYKDSPRAEVENESIVRIRHSLFGWANLLKHKLYCINLICDIDKKLTEIYPCVWPLLFDSDDININASEWYQEALYIDAKTETDPRFIDVSFRLTAMLPVARQWYKAKVGRIESEESRRYVDHMPSFHYIDEWSERPSGSIKQGAGGNHSNQWLPKLVQWLNIGMAKLSYSGLIKLGYAPEQVRVLLPQSMEVQWIETASLATYKRIMTQRLDSHAQKEIQTLAEQVNVLLTDNSKHWNKM